MIQVKVSLCLKYFSKFWCNFAYNIVALCLKRDVNRSWLLCGKSTTWYHQYQRVTYFLSCKHTTSNDRSVWDRAYTTYHKGCMAFWKEQNPNTTNIRILLNVHKLVNPLRYKTTIIVGKVYMKFPQSQISRVGMMSWKRIIIIKQISVYAWRE